MSVSDNSFPTAGVLCVVGGMMFLGFSDNFVVNIAEHASLWQFHAFRAAIILPMLVILSIFGLGAVRPKKPRAVFARSACFGFAMLIYFGCLAFLPISEVVGALFSAPIFVMIISVVFLGKTVGVLRWTAALIGFAGILMVLRPDAGALTWVSALPLVAAIFYAISAVATRQWCDEEDTITLLFWFFLIVGLCGVAGMIALQMFPQDAPMGPDGFILRGYTAPNSAFWLWTCVNAVGSILGIGLLTRGYQIGEASYVAVFEYSLMIFASFWAFVLRGEILDNWAVTGIVLIIFSGAVIALRTR